MRRVIWLQIPTVFWLGGGSISLSCSVYMGLVMLGRQTSAEAFEVEMANKKLKRHKSPGTDQIPAEMIKSGSRTIRWEIRKLINSLWSKEELPKE